MENECLVLTSLASVSQASLLIKNRIIEVHRTRFRETKENYLCRQRPHDAKQFQ